MCSRWGPRRGSKAPRLWSSSSGRLALLPRIRLLIWVRRRRLVGGGSSRWSVLPLALLLVRALITVGGGVVVIVIDGGHRLGLQRSVNSDESSVGTWQQRLPAPCADGHHAQQAEQNYTGHSSCNSGQLSLEQKMNYKHTDCNASNHPSMNPTIVTIRIVVLCIDRARETG